MRQTNPSLDNEQLSWFDDNRQRFKAETTSVPTKFDKCTHKNLKRKTATEVQCECGAGWIDGGAWTFFV